MTNGVVMHYLEHIPTFEKKSFLKKDTVRQDAHTSYQPFVNGKRVYYLAYLADYETTNLY